MLLSSGSRHDLRGVSLSELAQEGGVADLARTIHLHHLEATRRLDDLQAIYSARFQDRFRLFGEPLPAAEFVRRICEHHEMVQRAKSREGKRTWFDRIGSERVYIRPNYRLSAPAPASHRYVHEYRTNPIRRFRGDLT